MADRHNQGMTAIWVSLISNVALTVLKLAVGVLFGSPVLVADGVHNAGDIIATIAALSSSMVSKKPADEDHPYGHGKAEVVAAALVAVILVLAAFWIGAQSVAALFQPPKSSESWLALGAAAISLIWKQVLYVYTIGVGRRNRSKSVMATAYDHLADVYSSAAAVLGIGLGVLGERMGWSWAGYGDPVAGIIVSLLVLKLAYQMGRESVDILMEKNAAPEKLARYETLVREVAHVERVDRIRAREHGHYVTIDVRVGIPGSYTIQQGHDITRRIKQAVMDADPSVVEVLVHVNPWYEGEQ